MFASYMINTWISASLIAIVAALVGSVVVLRKESFASHAIPNGAFAGAAGATLLGVNIFFGLGIFAILTAMSVSVNRVRAKADSGTALALVTFLAIGSAFISQLSSSGSTASSLLFGQILGVSRLDVLIVALLGAVFLIVFNVLYKRLVFTAVLPEVAMQRGINLKRVEIAFLLLVAVVTTISVPLVGSMLVFSLMIAPAASSAKLFQSPVRVLTYGVLFSLLLVWFSIALAFESNWPISFFVASGGTLGYLTVTFTQEFKNGTFTERFKTKTKP
jgi:zinc/manganese transport system permease protein